MQTPHQPPLIFGEALFDCFSDGNRVLGGAPFNVTWHLQAFGLQPVFVSRVGDDALGREIIRAMEGWGMTTAYVQRDAEHPTGRVEVTIADDEPSFDILPEQAYDYIDAAPLQALSDAALLYHGSLALRHPASRGAFRALLEHMGAPRFVDINLRKPWWTESEAVALLEDATWCKLNDGELAALQPQPCGLLERTAAFQERCGARLLLITRGKAGALARTLEGEVHQVKPAADLTVVDTVGAGDAFTAVVLLGLIRHWSLPMMLQRAQDFASAVVNLRGATTRDFAFYEPFLTQWEN